MTTGRATTFTAAIAEDICAKLADGMSLREICQHKDMPPESTVRTWVTDDREGFSAQYARAREAGYIKMADDLIDISDNGSNDWMERNGDENEGWITNGEAIQRSRLRVDTRKWMLSKVLPKIYGDKIDVAHTGDVTMTFETVYERPED